jgi:hypothetical protein
MSLLLSPFSLSISVRISHQLRYRRGRSASRGGGTFPAGGVSFRSFPASFSLLSAPSSTLSSLYSPLFLLSLSIVYRTRLRNSLRREDHQRGEGALCQRGVTPFLSSILYPLSLSPSLPSLLSLLFLPSLPSVPGFATVLGGGGAPAGGGGTLPAGGGGTLPAGGGGTFAPDGGGTPGAFAGAAKM